MNVKDQVSALWLQLEEVETFQQTLCADAEKYASTCFEGELRGQLRILDDISFAANTQAEFDHLFELDRSDHEYARSIAGDDGLRPSQVHRRHGPTSVGKLSSNSPTINDNVACVALAHKKYDGESISADFGAMEIVSRECGPKRSDNALRPALRSVSLDSLDGHKMRKGDETPSKLQCSVCLSASSTANSAQFDCGHINCMECLTTVFKTALGDRALVPIRCCRREIDQSWAERLLPLRDATKFKQILLEKSTVEATMCTDETVGEANDAEFEAVCKELGYSRCSRCGMHVELSMGCNHMTCVCRHEFCFVCKATWKSCACVLFDEVNLLREAQIRAGPRANPAAVRVQAERIRALGECDVHTWTRVNRHGGSCRNCDFYMSCYFFQCQGCEWRVCYVCRFHRL